MSALGPRAARARGRSAALPALAALALVLVCAPRPAAAQLTELQLARRQGAGWWARFKGSAAQLSTYLGSGTLLTGEHGDNPYVGQDLLLLPRLNLTGAQSVRLLWGAGCEYTPADNGASGRRCSPSDLRLSYHHIGLWRDPWIGGRLTGSAQLWLPVSYESRANHTLSNLRGAAGYLVRVARDRLELRYDLAVQKYLPTRRARGYGGARSDGDGVALCLARAGRGDAAACGSGGPLNDNVLVINSLHVAWFFSDRLWLSADVLLYNYFRFAVTDDPLTPPGLPRGGRADQSWGTLELAYQLQPHLVLALGSSSRQPALHADGRWPRFPFWDFVSPANNFSQLYVAATAIY